MSASGKKDQVRNQNANLRDEIQKILLDSGDDFDMCIKRINVKVQLAIFERLGDVLVRLEDQ